MKRPEAPAGTVQLWTGSDLVWFDGHDLVINRPGGVIKGVTTYSVSQISGIQITKATLSFHVFRVLVAGESTPRSRQTTRELMHDPFVVQFTKKCLPEAEAVAAAVRDAQARLRQPAVPVAPQPAAQDLAGQLQRLAELHATGVLSDAEFASAKQRLIGGGARPQDAPGTPW